MDPAFIAMVGTVVGGCFIQVINHLARKQKVQSDNNQLIAKVISTTTLDDSHNHRTRELEKELFPDWPEDWYTECKCRKCNPPVPAPMIQPAIKQSTGSYRKTFAGYGFDVPDFVPRDASFAYDEVVRVGIFKWYETNGKMRTIKIIPALDLATHEIYSDQYDKPILTVRPKRFNNPSDYEVAGYREHYRTYQGDMGPN